MKEVRADSSAAYNLLHQGILALAKAERQGMRIDMEYCNAKTEELTEMISNIEEEFMASDFFKTWKKYLGKTPNIHSNPQLSDYLYGSKQYKAAKLTTSGKGSTDVNALDGLGIPALQLLVRARKLKKIRDTYLGAFMREQVAGVLHPSFNLHTVRTFRSSSNNPNFQNIPKRDKEAMQICRKAIYPRHGHQLFEVDFGALEVRIAACYHQDPTMMKYIKENHDMHGDMAKQIFKIKGFDKSKKEHSVLRAAAKNGFVFPQFYGDYYKNCATNLLEGWGDLSLSRKWKKTDGIAVDGEYKLAEHLIETGLGNLELFTKHLQRIENHFWNTRFPVYRDWKEKWWRQYQENGFVDMFTGFRCKGIMSRNDAINYPVQGAAFHCLLWCLIRITEIFERDRMQSLVIGQIHDAVVLDVYPPELNEVARIVKQVTTVDLPRAWKWINVPLTVEAELAGVDESYADMKEFILP